MGAVTTLFSNFSSDILPSSQARVRMESSSKTHHDIQVTCIVSVVETRVLAGFQTFWKSDLFLSSWFGRSF